MPNIDTSKIPSVDALRPRFSFIGNQSLQTNVCIAFQYIIFLISLLEEEDSLPGPIRYSLYKSTILYTASIFEACLHFCIWELVDKGKVIATDVRPFEWQNTEEMRKYDISDKERIFGIVQTKSQDKLKTSTQFQVLNKACRKANILSQTLFEKAEWLRTQRNQIHLVGLSNNQDVYPERKDVEKAFAHAKDIIEVLEKHCNKT